MLDDPKNLFGAQNIIPLVNKAALTDTIKSTLNAISAKLDTPTLAALVKKVVSDKADPDQVASRLAEVRRPRLAVAGAVVRCASAPPDAN